MLRARALSLLRQVCVKGCELTLVEQRTQIDQFVRVKVDGASGLAFDEVAQIACIGPRFLFEGEVAVCTRLGA